jgi:hypothetical protein
MDILADARSKTPPPTFVATEPSIDTSSVLIIDIIYKYGIQVNTYYTINATRLFPFPSGTPRSERDAKNILRSRSASGSLF